METATKNHLALNFYKRCCKYIQDLNPNLTKQDIYNVMVGIYEKNYSGNNQVVLQFCILLRNQVLIDVVIESDASNILKAYQDILT